MSLRNFPVFPSLTDSAFFSDRFNRIDRLFSQLTGDSPMSSTPSYDLKQHDSGYYSLTVSVPGWQEKELDIEAADGRMTITGRKEVVDNSAENTEDNNIVWLHRGIRRTDFCLSYNIPEHIKVTEARLQDGLLSVMLYLEIPESEKPQRIPIKHHNHKSDAIEHQG